MIIKNIGNQQRFQSVNSSFSFTIPYSTTATLYMSADGVNFYPYNEQITAPDTVVVNGVVEGMYFYIDGLTDNITINL